MNTLIVYAHPYDKSFNHAILQEVVRLLRENAETFQLIDLYADGFNPALSAAELAQYKAGQALDPLVVQYQQYLQEADRLIFIFPIWWYDTPAIVKGFLDKVMLKPFAYQDSRKGPIPQLTHIREAWVITTSTAPTPILRFLFGNAIQSVFINSSLKGLIGKGKSRWLNLGGITDSSLEKRQAFLRKLARYI